MILLRHCSQSVHLYVSRDVKSVVKCVRAHQGSVLKYQVDDVGMSECAGMLSG